MISFIIIIMVRWFRCFYVRVWEMTSGESGVKAPECGAETGNALHNISYCVIEYVWERTVQHLYFSTLSSYNS